MPAAEHVWKAEVYIESGHAGFGMVDLEREDGAPRLQVAPYYTIPTTTSANTFSNTAKVTWTGKAKS